MSRDVDQPDIGANEVKCKLGSLTWIFKPIPYTMPFTPLHFGPGAAIKAAIPTHFSFTVFCYAQVVTDLEPGYFLLRGEYAVHRFFHTYLGATLVGAFCTLTGRPLCEWFLRVWPSPLLSPLNTFLLRQQNLWVGFGSGRRPNV